MVLFVFPVCNFGKFINFGLGTVRSERVKELSLTVWLVLISSLLQNCVKRIRRGEQETVADDDNSDTEIAQNIGTIHLFSFIRFMLLAMSYSQM